MSNRRTTILGTALGAVCALLVSVATAQAETGSLKEEFHQTYAVQADGRVTLNNINGDVRIGVWDRNEVKVDAVKSANTQERLKEAKIVVDASSGAVHIKTEYPRNNNTWNSNDRDNPARVDYVLTVPRNARLNGVELVNGNLFVEGVHGDVRLSAVNGKVETRSLGGRVELNAVNGTVDAQFQSAVVKPVELNCVNGTLRLTMPSDVNAVVEASTVNGSIRNNFNLPVSKGRFVGRDLKGQIGNGGVPIRLESVNGKIEILHAEDGKPLSKVTNLLRTEPEQL